MSIYNVRMHICSFSFAVRVSTLRVLYSYNTRTLLRFAESVAAPPSGSRSFDGSDGLSECVPCKCRWPGFCLLPACAEEAPLGDGSRSDGAGGWTCGPSAIRRAAIASLSGIFSFCTAQQSGVSRVLLFLFYILLYFKLSTYHVYAIMLRQ